MGVDRYHSKHPLCYHSDVDYGKWYWISLHIIIGGFVIVWVIFVTKMIQTNPGTERKICIIGFNAITIATVSAMLSVFFDWGVCIDSLGYFFLLFLIPNFFKTYY